MNQLCQKLLVFFQSRLLYSHGTTSVTHLVAMVSISLLTALVSQTCWAVDEIPPDVFLRDYQDALKRLQADLDHGRIKGKMKENLTITGKNDPIRDRIYKFEYKRNGENVEKLTFDNGVSQYEQRVYVFSKTPFWISRKSESHNYSLNDYGPFPSVFKVFLDDHKRLSFSASYSIGNEYVHIMMESGRFVVRKATRITQNDKPLIRVEFDHTPADPKTQIYGMTGWFLVDPAHNWAVVEHEVKKNDLVNPKDKQVNEVISGSVRYSNREGCTLFPEDVSLTILSLLPDGRKFERRYQFQLEECSTDPIPDSEFTLAAYGLGDVEQPPGAPTNTLPYWAFGFAIVAMAISVVLKRMARQA